MFISLRQTEEESSIREICGSLKCLKISSCTISETNIPPFHYRIEYLIDISLQIYDETADESSEEKRAPPAKSSEKQSLPAALTALPSTRLPLSTLSVAEPEGQLAVKLAFRSDVIIFVSS